MRLVNDKVAMQPYPPTEDVHDLAWTSRINSRPPRVPTPLLRPAKARSFTNAVFQLVHWVVSMLGM